MGISYDYRCQECGYADVRTTEYKERDSPQECSECEQGRMFRYYGKMPTNLRASYPDGMKRPGFEDFRKITELNQQLADSGDKSEQKRIKSEIKERERLR